MILLSLASKQIWPQVLSVAYLKPERLVLLHSGSEAESRGPAQRLRDLLARYPSLDPAKGITLEAIPHDDFAGICRRYSEIVESLSTNPESVVANITGGNKLMAAAVLQTALQCTHRPFYLERQNQITWFEPGVPSANTRVEKLPESVTDDIDPSDLLACQFGHECLVSRGERIVLNESGRNLNPKDLQQKLQGDSRLSDKKLDFRKWLAISEPLAARGNVGDSLEYATALALLLCGVPMVRRSVEWLTRPGSTNSEGELDLIFNWRGRLWVVDCKDKASYKDKLEGLKSKLVAHAVPMLDVAPVLESIEDDLRDRDLKVLREDLMQISEVGGLQAFVIAVRSASPPIQALEFAARRHPRIEIVQRKELLRRLPAILQVRTTI